MPDTFQGRRNAAPHLRVARTQVGESRHSDQQVAQSQRHMVDSMADADDRYDARMRSPDRPLRRGITDWRYGVNTGGEWVRRVAWPARSPTDTRRGCFNEGRNGSRE